MLGTFLNLFFGNLNNHTLFFNDITLTYDHNNISLKTPFKML